MKECDEAHRKENELRNWWLGQAGDRGQKMHEHWEYGRKFLGIKHPPAVAQKEWTQYDGAVWESPRWSFPVPHGLGMPLVEDLDQALCAVRVRAVLESEGNALELLSDARALILQAMDLIKEADDESVSA